VPSRGRRDHPAAGDVEGTHHRPRERFRRTIKKEGNMSGRIGIRGLVCAGILAALLAGAGLVLNAGNQAGSDIPLRAMFIRGTELGVRDAGGNLVPNKIVNDIENLYYENGPNTSIVLMGDPDWKGVLDWIMTTGKRSPRYVNYFFDSVITPVGSNLSSICGQDYFLDRGAASQIGTYWFWMMTGGEWVLIPDPTDGIPILKPLENNPKLNLAAMADGQTAYAYLDRYMFSVPDNRATKYNETRDDYNFADCKWVKVVASASDGTMVNTWTLSPVTGAFKHDDFDPESHAWCVHPEGAIPQMLYSNARLSCNHGTYRMPWQLVVTRRPN
jgi:hypothetical protein